MALPPAVDQPCRECPWRRASVPGWLGPYQARDWLTLAHSDEPIACHLTIPPSEDGDYGWDDWADTGIRQCRGIASYRANTAKVPRDPEVARGPRDPEHIFRTWDEFLAHHGGQL